jgi:hypothetical protein
VGFLRPTYLVVAMITELDNPNPSPVADPAPTTSLPKASAPKPAAPKPAAPGDVFVRGIVRSQPDSKPIAGALVGIVPLGTMKVTEENLLAWGNTNTSGQFRLNNSIQPGRYLLRATAIGHTPYSREIEITQDTSQFVIEMRSSSGQ